MNKKAVVLLSGGLDSTLAAKIVQNQGIEVYGLNFTSAFCTCTSKKKEGSCSEAISAAKFLKMPIKIMQKGLDYLEIIKSPKFGYGRALNPCIDCRIYVLKKAKEYMKEIGASFVVTGEVLGQRPKSQKFNFLRLIEKESGLHGLILRPLSAKLLPPSLPEESGIVDRNKLCNISGKSRKKQIILADYLNINEYPCASGGCRLTEKEFVPKVRDYLENEDSYNLQDLFLLRYGRHFRIFRNHRIIIGKDESENKLLKNYALKNDIVIEPEFAGPTALIKGVENKNLIKVAISLILKFSKKDKINNFYKVIVDGKEKSAEIKKEELKENDTFRQI